MSEIDPGLVRRLIAVKIVRTATLRPCLAPMDPGATLRRTAGQFADPMVRVRFGAAAALWPFTVVALINKESADVRRECLDASLRAGRVQMRTCRP